MLDVCKEFWPHLEEPLHERGHSFATMSQPRSPQRRHRDADEEALQNALRESLQPDFMAQILRAEANTTAVTSPSVQPRASPRVATPQLHLSSVDDEDDDAMSDKSSVRLGAAGLTDDEGDDEDEDVNRDNVLLNFAEYLLVDMLRYLDEDSVGNCIAACKRLRHVASSDALFETICRRVFPVQCPRVAVAAAKNRFALRKFPTWLDMFRERPRVRYNGFYYHKTFYYKKPELNMWTDIAPGTILQVVYYRYFSFQRDGSVLYAMLFKAPHESGTVLKRAPFKEVHRGSFQVDKNEVFVSVPTDYSVVEFRFRISADSKRGKNVKLVLQEHLMFSQPNRTGWVDHFDTHEEEYCFYRQWDL